MLFLSRGEAEVAARLYVETIVERGRVQGVGAISGGRGTRSEVVRDRPSPGLVG